MQKRHACPPARSSRQSAHRCTLNPSPASPHGQVKPQFAYAAGKAPPSLDALYDRLLAADAYVMVTPEYNHAPSPALVNILNHFGRRRTLPLAPVQDTHILHAQHCPTRTRPTPAGSSVFSFKPSAIVSYSQGQWGGCRAAVGLRPILSELGEMQPR